MAEQPPGGATRNSSRGAVGSLPGVRQRVRMTPELAVPDRRAEHSKRRAPRLAAGLRLVAALAALPLAGCVNLSGANTPLEQFDPAHGYRTLGAAQRREPGRTIIYLAFSGGGTRAAAFAYGVLEELRDTPISVDGAPKTLLDEVDTISGVSGGSFPAAYYGLYGDRIFEEFEPRFLKKNVQGALVLQMLRPWNLLGLMTPWLSRSDLASDYYHKRVFDEATFADLTEARGPRIHINATDLSSGERFTFNQDSFDLICSDLDVLPIATAVASSSAVPMLLSPITLKNHAGSCGYEPPQWVVEALEGAGEDERRNRAARNYARLRDAENKRFIHLIDGGVSDNLGLRAAIDFVTAVGGIETARRVQEVEVPDRLIIIVVNAETDPDPMIDLSAASPSFASLMNSVSGGQIRRYNLETLLLTKSLLEQWGRSLSSDEHRVTTHMINVSFDALEDPDERRYFKRTPTSFTLSDTQVDRLREAGRQLLRDSPEFQRLLQELR
jgi:NTE family protein